MSFFAESEFAAKIAEMIRDTRPPAQFAASSAIVHIDKAALLADIDPQMAAFRAITAEEESATALFRQHREALSPAIAAEFAAGRDPLGPPRLEFTRDHAASAHIDGITGGAVILAGSGMATGGRVLRHLQRELPRSQSAVVFVGFAALGTPARQIIDGARQVRILNAPVDVRAEIHTIGGFSAHADRDELLAWHARVQAGRTFLVHGEKSAMAAFAASLPAGTRIDQPQLGQSFDL